MKYKKYLKLWLLFINIKGEEGYEFNDLIEVENKSDNNFTGAWANIIVKANTINEALEIAPLGLKELGFKVEFIEKIENFMTLIENEELKKDVIKEGDWLLKSNFVFRISDKIFPYV